jgi:hypothetical protein
MEPVRNPDFETNRTSYEASIQEWQEVWNSIDRFARELHSWVAPWLDTSMRDGNPIFSAWSPILHRAVRIIQHGDASTFAVWRNTFARGSSHAVDELVIDCALTDEHVRRARDLVVAWLNQAQLTHRQPLDVEMPRSDRAA